MSDEITDLIVHLGNRVRQLVNLITDRVTNNVTSSVTNMSAQQWIRLVAIVGAYALLRPFIIKLGAKHSGKEFEKAQQDTADLTPNEIRGELGIPDESDDDDDKNMPGAAEAGATGADWGKKARKRQRRMIKQLLDAEEARLHETFDEQEDKDIAEFLTD
ncbi:protein trafficking Pga2 [Astrocystis sublimbata]|nr:protein trafficking Pga2 [Astrocystis sublimbata]